MEPAGQKGIVLLKPVNSGDFDTLLSGNSDKKKFELAVQRFVKRFDVSSSFPLNPTAGQEFFIVQGLSIGIANSEAAQIVLGPAQNQSAVADAISGIIFQRPVAADGSNASTSPMTIKIINSKKDSLPQENANWLYLCPECPKGPDTTASAAATQTVPVPAKKAEEKTDERLINLQFDSPCANTMKMSLEQINRELVKYGLWADQKPVTRAYQIFTVPPKPAPDKTAPTN